MTTTPESKELTANDIAALRDLLPPRPEEFIRVWLKRAHTEGLINYDQLEHGRMFGTQRFK